MPSSSPPPSPPSRPVPARPASNQADDPLSPDPEPTQLPSLVVDPEAEIDASTLRFLSASFRALFLPWLIRLVLFTSAAKLVRFTAPYLLTALGWTFRHFGTAMSWLIRALSWLALWTGLIGTAVWILAGCVGAIAYSALRLRPQWRVFKRQQPFASYGLRCAALYGTAWLGLRLVIRLRARWCTRLVGFVALALEAWSFVHQREAAQAAIPTEPIPVAVPTPSPDDDTQSSAARSTSTRAEHQADDGDFAATAQRSAYNAPSLSPSSSQSAPLANDDPSIPGRDADETTADGDLAEKWARQVREEMLRESLLAQGKKRRTTTAAASSTSQRQQSGSVDEDLDST